MTTRSVILKSDIHTRSIAARFSAAAKHYNRHADAQLVTAVQLCSMLSGLPKPARILDVGCGTGNLIRLLRKRFPNSCIHGVDISNTSVQVAGKRFAADSQIHLRAGDARRITYRKAFDLIVSNSSLHWMMPLDSLFENIRRLITPDGMLVFSMMVRGTLRELRATRLTVAPSKPPRSQLPGTNLSLVALSMAGFKMIQSQTDDIRIEYPSARAFLRAIHNAGVTGGPVSIAAGGSKPGQNTLLNSRELSALAAYYEKHYKNGMGGVYATYRALYVTAKPA